MADHIINAQIKLNLSQPNIKPMVDSIQKQFASRGINLPVNLKFNKVNEAEIAKQSAAFRSMARTLASLNTSSIRAAGALNTLNQSFKQISVTMRTFGAAGTNLSNLRNQIVTTNRTVTQLGKGFQGAHRHVTTFVESIGISARRFLSFGAAAAVLATVSYNIRNAVVAALEFDREMVRLRQVSGDSWKIIGGIEKTISKLGTSLGVSSKDMSQAAVTIRQAGFSARETQKILESLGKTTLSPTFEDLKTTTEGVIAVMKQFGVTGNQLEGTLSAISKVSADFPVESTDLVEAIKRVGGAFKAAGGNVNELLAMFTAIRGTTRESAESIATGMRTIISRLQDPKIARNLHNIGVEVYDLQGQFVGPYKAVERLSEALTKLPAGNIQVNQVLKDIGGLRQLSRVTPLIYNIDTMKDAYRSAMESSGTLSKDAVMAQEALIVQIDRLKESFLDLFRVISTDAAVRGTLSSIITLVQSLTTAMRELKPLIPIFLTIGGAKLAGALYSRRRQFSKGFNQPVSGYADGGFISGGHPGRDSVHAMLMPGEFVINKEAAQGFGYKNLYQLNNAKKAGRLRRLIDRYGDYTGDQIYNEQMFHRESTLKMVKNFRGTPKDWRNYIKAKRKGQAKDLKDILNTHRLEQHGIGPSRYALSNVSEVINKVIANNTPTSEYKTPTSVYDSVRDIFVPVQGFSKGGKVEKQYTIQDLQDYFDKHNIPIKASDYINGITYSKDIKVPGVKSAGSSFDPITKTINLKPGSGIEKLFHEFGHGMNINGDASKWLSDISGTPQAKIAAKYQTLPGIMEKSLLGGGGLNKYPQEHHSNEAFANSIASYLLQKGGLPSPNPTAGSKGLHQSVGNLIAGRTISPPRKPPTNPPVATSSPFPNNFYNESELPIIGQKTPSSIGNNKSLILPPSYSPTIPQNQFQHTYNNPRILHGQSTVLSSKEHPFTSTSKLENIRRMTSSRFNTHPQGRIFNFSNDEIYKDVAAENTEKRKKIQEQKVAQRFKKIQQENGMVAIDIQNLDKIGTSKFFPTYQKWLKNTSSFVKNINTKMNQTFSGLSAHEFANLTTKEKSAHMKESMFRSQVGLGTVAALTPMAVGHIFGDARKPGLGGLHGSRVGNTAGGLVTGATGGAAVGASFGPWGLAIGGFIGGLVGATSSLKQFDSELKEVRTEQAERMIGRVNFNEKSGNFATEEDAKMFSSAIEKMLPSTEEQRTIHGNNLGYIGRIKEEYQTQGLKGAFFTGFGANTTGIGTQSEQELGMDENTKRAVSDQALGLLKQLTSKNPEMSRKQIMEMANMGFQNRQGVTAERGLNLSEENTKSFESFWKTTKSTAETQRKFNELLIKSNQEFEINIAQLEKFTSALEVGSEQFDKRQHYATMSGSALRGQLMASPNDVGIQYLGRKGSFANELGIFSNKGGGFDQARQKLIELLQQESKKNLGNMSKEELSNEDIRTSERVGNLFRESNIGGSFNKEMSEHIKGQLGVIPDVNNALKNGPAALADRILEKYNQVAQSGRGASKQLQDTYAKDQQNKIDLMNREFELNQTKAQQSIGRGEFMANRATLQERERPESSLIESRVGTISPQRMSRTQAILNEKLIKGTLNNRDMRYMRGKNMRFAFHGRFLSPEERALNRSEEFHRGAFNQARSQFEGANLTTPELEKGINQKEEQLQNLFTQRNRASTGPSLEEVKSVQNQIDTLNKKEQKIAPNVVAAGMHLPAFEGQRKALESKMSDLYKGNNLGNLRQLDQQILSTQKVMRDYAEQVKLLANNTHELEDAQAKYELAQQQALADYESRKKDADVLAFGSKGDKMQMMTKENITQRALSLGHEEFANLPDMIKQIVFQRLNETQGMTREVQGYDKYGREAGRREVTSESALEYFRQPYLNQLTSGRTSALLNARKNQAGDAYGAASERQFQAQDTLNNLNKKNINKESIMSEDNFNKFTQGINQSIEKQMEATNKFLAGSAELTNALNSFNGHLTIERNGKVEVILNGGAVMQAMKGDMQKEVMQSIINQLQIEIQKAMKNQPAR